MVLWCQCWNNIKKDELCHLRGVKKFIMKHYDSHGNTKHDTNKSFIHRSYPKLAYGSIYVMDLPYEKIFLYQIFFYPTWTSKSWRYFSHKLKYIEKSQKFFFSLYIYIKSSYITTINQLYKKLTIGCFLTFFYHIYFKNNHLHLKLINLPHLTISITLKVL